MTPGAHYLVDLGQLVPAMATSARDAYRMAVLAVYGPGMPAPRECATVYSIAADGQVLTEVTECTS